MEEFYLKEISLLNINLENYITDLILTLEFKNKLQSINTRLNNSSISTSDLVIASESFNYLCGDYNIKYDKLNYKQGLNNINIHIESILNSIKDKILDLVDKIKDAINKTTMIAKQLYAKIIHNINKYNEKLIESEAKLMAVLRLTGVDVSDSILDEYFNHFPLFIHFHNKKFSIDSLLQYNNIEDILKPITKNLKETLDLLAKSNFKYSSDAMIKIIDEIKKEHSEFNPIFITNINRYNVKVIGIENSVYKYRTISLNVKSDLEKIKNNINKKISKVGIESLIRAIKDKLYPSIKNDEANITRFKTDLISKIDHIINENTVDDVKLKELNSLKELSSSYDLDIIVFMYNFYRYYMDFLIKLSDDVADHNENTGLKKLVEFIKNNTPYSDCSIKYLDNNHKLVYLDTGKIWGEKIISDGLSPGFAVTRNDPSGNFKKAGIIVPNDIDVASTIVIYSDYYSRHNILHHGFYHEMYHVMTQHPMGLRPLNDIHAEFSSHYKDLVQKALPILDKYAKESDKFMAINSLENSANSEEKDKEIARLLYEIETIYREYPDMYYLSSPRELEPDLFAGIMLEWDIDKMTEFRCGTMFIEGDEKTKNQFATFPQVKWLENITRSIYRKNLLGCMPKVKPYADALKKEINRGLKDTIITKIKGKL